MKQLPAMCLVAVLAFGAAGVTACRSGQSVGSQVDDATIKAEVKAKLAKDVRLSTLTNIEVNSTQGVVTLSGMVPNADDKAKAGEIARKVGGVTRVHNELQVESPERR